MKQSELNQSVPWPFIIIFFVFSFFVISGGILYYKNLKKRIVTEKQNELAAIASLKVDGIAKWRKERFGDGMVINKNGVFIREVSNYLSHGNPEDREDIILWMKTQTLSYDYQSVLLLDKEKKLRLSFPAQDNMIGEISAISLPEVIKENKVQMTDLHRSENVPNIHLDLLVPLFKNSTTDCTLVGIIILRIDAKRTLFPLIQSWPTPSGSSETLLLSLEGDSVVYLNELRHQKNTALRLRFPTSLRNLPAAKAVTGFEGAFEGSDYRNVPVISYMKKIPDSPWYMVAKTDKAEIYLPLNEQATIISIIIALLILSASGLIGILWRNQRVRYYKNQLKTENERRKAEEELKKSERMFRSLFENMLNGFSYCKMIYDKGNRPADFIYLTVNGAFEALTGLKNVTGKKVSEVIPGFCTTDFELLNLYGQRSE
jgi:two-component system, cell cycle sensor histidine kinase and response regulator CckA